MTIQNAPPATPTIGQVYYDVHLMQMMVYVATQSGNQWVPASKQSTAYFLFVDDERQLSSVSLDWKYRVEGPSVIARSSEEAKRIVEERGLPLEISFDHDLGGDDTAFKFMWWLINRHLDEAVDLSKLLCIHVHSANEVGARKLINLWTNFCEVNSVNVSVKRLWPMEKT